MESVDTLDDLLKKLLGAIPEVKSAAIVSAEGLPIASALPQGVDEKRIAAMTAALLSLSKRAILEMSKGDFDQLYIKGSEGYLLVMQAGPSEVLVVSTTNEVRLGLILLDYRRFSEKIARSTHDDDDGEDLLKNLLGAIPELKNAAKVSVKGVFSETTLPKGLSKERVAKMAAAIFSLSERLIIEMGKGEIDQLYIKGSEGYFIVTQTGSNAVLAVSTSKNFRFGELPRFGLSDDDDDDAGGDYLPYPYIFTPPNPPDDFEMAPQVQLRAPLIEKDPEDEYYCQYCGMELTKEEQLTHSCKNKPKIK